MANAEVPNVPLTQPKRKRYFPFGLGLRSQPDAGQGASAAINAMPNKNGHVGKTPGVEQFKQLLGVTDIPYIFEYEKEDGTTQVLAIYAVDEITSFVMRAIEEDGSVTTPVGAEASLTGAVTFTNGSSAVSASGGAFTTELTEGDWVYFNTETGDMAQVLAIADDNNLTLATNYTGTGGSGAGKSAVVHFTGDIFDYDVMGGKGWMVNNSTTTPGYSWDGETLSPVANLPAQPIGIGVDGNRLGIINANSAKFSGDDIIDSNDFTSGAGVNRHGDYATAISRPKAIVSPGDGVVIFGRKDGELHKVQANAASDDVNSITKQSVFSYKGEGVDDGRKVCVGKYFIYLVNPTGVEEVNPASGGSTPLFDIGAIEKAWKDIVHGTECIGYDATKKMVAVCARSKGINDTLFMIDIEQKNRPVCSSEFQYYSCLATVNNRLYGGSSRDGKITKVLEGATDIGGTGRRFLYRTETDAIGSATIEKTLRKFAFYVEGSPLSKYTIRVKINGGMVPVFEKTLRVTPEIKQASTIGQYGKYVFRLAESSVQDIANTIRQNQKNARFSTVEFELEEFSTHDLYLKDLVIEYKSRGRFIRKFRSVEV